MPAVGAPSGGNKYARPAPPRVIVQAPTLPPIITAVAPPARSYAAPSHAAAYAAAPHTYTPVTPMPRSLPPQIRGHWVTTPHGTVLIHAVGPGKWAEGPAAGYPSPPKPRPAPGSDEAIDAYKQTDAYKQAIVDVFLHQNDHQRQAILVGAMKNPDSPEGSAVLDYLRNAMTPADARPHGPGVLTQRTPGVPRPAAAYRNPVDPIHQVPNAAARFEPAAIRAQLNLGANINQIPLSGVGQFFSNVAKDIVGIAPGTLEALAGTGAHVGKSLFYTATGQLGKAGKEADQVAKGVIDPYVHLAQHPLETPYQHPVNTALMLLGLKALVGKGIGNVGRAAGADWASTAREPLQIGTIQGRASPIFEERSYSRDMLNKAFQVARESSLRKRGIDPNLAQESRIPFDWIKHSFNIGAEAKLNRIADEMSSVRQTLGRAERARVAKEAMGEAPSQESRHVVSHVLQGVIRKPETAVADAAKEAERLRQVRTHKRSIHGYWNKRQVRDLETAMNTPVVRHVLPDGSSVQIPQALSEAFDAAAKIRPVIHGHDAWFLQKGLLSPDQLMARLFPYAQAHMGAHFDWGERRLVNAEHPEGIPVEAIHRHLEDNNVPDPAYVGHYENKAASWRYYQRYNLTRGSLGSKHRTGEAFRLGGYDHTYDGLAGQLAARAEAATKATLHDKVITRLGIKKPPEVVAKEVRRVFAQMRTDLGKARSATERTQIEARARREVASLRTGYYSPAEAKRATYATGHDDFGNPSDLELTPVTAFPARGGLQSVVRGLQDPQGLNLPEHEVNALTNAIHDAGQRTDQTRNVVLVPKVATDRFVKQFERSHAALRVPGRITQQFRQTVLPYSTHWMLQIQTEAMLRAALAGVLPQHLKVGRELMARLQETPEGRAALAETIGSMFWTQHGQFGVHYDPNILVRGAKATPGISHIIRAHKLYSEGVNHAMTMLERQFRIAGLGKISKQQMQEFTRAWQGGVGTQAQLLDRLAHGLETNPALVAKFGRQIDDMFGKYSKFSPGVRAAIQSWTPFLSWYLTAAKYVFVTLPAHHPIASALLASLRQTINQDVADGKQMPLNPFAMQSFGTLSPFGIFTPESLSSRALFSEAMQKGSSLLLPQLSGAMYASVGKSPFGKNMYGPGGAVQAWSPEAGAKAGSNLAEALLPGLSKVRQGLEGGRTAYDTSTFWNPQVKPDQTTSWQKRVNRLLNPLYGFERALHPQPSAAGTTGAGFGMQRFGSGGGGGFGLTRFH